MGMGIMAKNKSISIEEDVKEIRRRIDNLTMQLFASDSEYALHQIPELRKRLDNLFSIIAMNDNEFRIFRDVVSALQRELYPKFENKEDFNAKLRRRKGKRDSKKETLFP